MVRSFDGSGDPVRGGRTINQTEAETVRRVFREFADGASPRTVARRLNEEKIPGPSGRLWMDTTIRGHAKRGTGLINNELYIGRLVWNRLHYVKNPETGRRVSRINPPGDWIVREVPGLRIVDDDLWQAVKRRQGELTEQYATVIEATQSARANRLNGAHRPRHLLSGLLECGVCGGPYSMRGQDRYGCSNHIMTGTCSNGIPRITKRSVDAVKAGGTDTVYWDGELTGFGLRVRRSGRKSYVVQTRIAGKLCWFTIGPHGPLNPDQARARALEILASAKKGIDPRDADARREAERNMADLGRRFLEEYVPVHCKPSTREEYRRSVRLFVDPVIGELRVPEVQRKDIAALDHGLRDKPYQANRTLAVLSKMFSLAEVWGWRPDGSNPCRHVKRYKEHKRERFLSPEETERLGQVLREAEEEMPSAVAAFRLLLLTGCRLSEIQFLRWEYVKDDCIELPDAKTGGRIVPLGPEARAVLSAIPRDDDNPWVIAGRLPGSHLTDLQRPWRRIRKREGLEDVRIHDLRHSFASRALALGESLTMIGKLLGHTQVQTTARYAHLARDSIQTAAARITGSIGGNLLGDHDIGSTLVED